MASNKKDYKKVLSLKNQLAFIIGGEGLLGKEITKAISACDAQTIVLDIIGQNREGTDNTSFRYFDCSALEGIEADLNDVIEEFGCPDIFINCSYPKTEDWLQNSFENITLNSFRKNVDIHMNSYAWLAKSIADEMSKQKNGGSIIQLGSTYGVLGQDLTVYEGSDMKENMTYAAIKGGITNLTRQMASYYGEYNIRVNTVCPGGILGHVAGKTNIQNTNFVKQYSQKTPLKRLGRPEEIASTVLFLASDASSYITGATIMVDCGWTAI